jgi:hypothetical protein
MKKLLCLVMIVFLSSFVYGAFGVGNYYSSRPIVMKRGETKVIEVFELQNMKTEDDVKAKLEIVSGDEIARLKEDEFLVEANSYDTMVPIKIKIPKNMSAGTYRVEIFTKTKPPESGGMVTMGVGMASSFNVLVSEERAEPEIPYLWILVAAIIIILVVIGIAAKKKNWI